MYRHNVKARLVVEEGKVLRVYLDSKKIPTFGIGHNAAIPVSERALNFVLASPIGDRFAEIVLEDDIGKAEDMCRFFWPRFDSFSENRKEALLDLAFNMGPTRAEYDAGKRHGIASFVNTNRAINEGRWDDAEAGFRNSQWYKDVGPHRAEPLLKLIKEG